MKTLRTRISLTLLTLSFVLSSCGAFKTAVFDQYSYQQAISLKIESKALLNKAVEPYTDHEQEVEDLKKEVEKMIEYEKNKENNNFTYKMWEVLADEDKNLLAGLLKRWKDQGQLSQVFVDQASPQVMEAFDLLIKYEGQKDKEGESGILNFLNNN
ncbi:hypothetical protein ACFQ1M_06945 [Sungkyunkwania multivorans]|uniref:Lipoprotein n=1 Tax=Sungkyunkwania multivorans TaxID=1173618 RepID=A0ABW3CWB6_9FLAO